MDLTTITVSDFKTQFPRDFPYLLAWSASKAYAVGDEVSKNSKIYVSILAGTDKDPETETTYWTEITVADSNYVNDSDIERAFVEAQMVFNPTLFGTDAQITLGYLYVTAHYLVMDLRASQKGVQGKGEFAVNSRSAGSVSESYSVPEWVTKDRILGYFTKTNYGMKYLSFVLPKLVGNVQAIAGRTRP